VFHRREQAVESDEALFLRVREGDMHAFDRLYERYEVRLFAYLRALLGDRRDAEEIFHDAFLNALRSANATFDDAGFRPWLYRIARNLALNKKRAEGRRERLHEAAGQSPAASSPGADAQLETCELEAALDAAVERLPPVLGELYHLRNSGLSYEQIASVVDAPLGTVKSRMHQMVHTLREELSPWIAPK
jgi:RNA polymerase sigma-70 factor, ECF subfamily